MTNLTDSTGHADVYKFGHYNMYPKGITELYSNFTPRSTKLAKMSSLWDQKITFVGFQGYLQAMCDNWSKTFFDFHEEVAVETYKNLADHLLGPGKITVEHFRALHRLGYLPLEIRALEEGSRVPVKIPLFTVRNTHPDFAWLVNYIETDLSQNNWKVITTATIAADYRKVLTHFAEETGSPLDFVPLQAHDFSARGMANSQDAARSGYGHLCSFIGSDTASALQYTYWYYNIRDTPVIACSVPATEHSVATSNILYLEQVLGFSKEEAEKAFIKALITEKYPTGIVSIVADSFDYWNVLTNISAELKDVILNRQEDALGLAKVVFRPDSGDPLEVICGTLDADATEGTPEELGSLRVLWNIFGGTINEKGYKVLNPRVGLIYGDSITIQRAEAILTQMKAMGFASYNIVFGVGSYTYQYITRDTLGLAMKATHAIIDGRNVELYKDPKTDSGLKKSAKGYLKVVKINGEYTLLENQTFEESIADDSELKLMFLNGVCARGNFKTFGEIRNNILKQL